MPASFRSTRPAAAVAASASGLTPAQARVLEREPWFARQAPRLKKEIVQRCIVRTYPARSLLYTAGSSPGGFYVVLAGEVRLEHVSRAGKFAFYQGIGPGGSFGMLSELDGSPRFSDARAGADTKVLHLPHADCQHLLRDFPGAQDAFLQYICGSLHTTLDILVEQHSAPPRTQIASILMSVFSRDAIDGGEPPKMTQETMAAMAGVSRPTAGKVLHEFRTMGLIEMQYGRIRPLDLAGLQEIARD